MPKGIIPQPLEQLLIVKVMVLKLMEIMPMPRVIMPKLSDRIAMPKGFIQWLKV